MFQSTGVQQGRHRPPIIHAYGGAKVGMAAALRSIAVEGWVPLAVVRNPPFGSSCRLGSRLLVSKHTKCGVENTARLDRQSRATSVTLLLSFFLPLSFFPTPQTWNCWSY